jgi:kynurenine formamidase
MTDLPHYDELPAAPQGGRSAWGLFGPEDNLGLINLMTPERVVEAARLVRRGALFPLNAPLDAFFPAIATGRGNPRHTVLHAPGTIGFDDVYDNFFPQASSQWDSLGHVGYAPDSFYNGATEADVVSGRRNTIDHWARHGIAGRGVLLDMVRTLAEAGQPYEIGTSRAFSVEELEMARERAGIEFNVGDILIVHTGFAAWYMAQPVSVRTSVARGATTPGIASGEEMCRYLWDAHVAAVASDTFAVEVFPANFTEPTGFIHRILIGQFGMALGELWWTEDLASDCARDGVNEFFLVSAPLHARGGIGSPPNAMAIK